jgi:hypothetical protein
MKSALIRCLWLLLAFLPFFSFPARAQDDQFLPEIDAYFRGSSEFRYYFQAKQTREGGDPTQAELGPSVEFYLKPWIHLRGAAGSDLDEAKKRALVFAVGYRYLPSPSAPTTNRLRLDLTSHVPLKAKILLTDRNRADLDWQNGGSNWRYRNKLTVERSFTIRSFAFRPYVAVEPFYESKYHKWSTTALYAGSIFPVGKHVEFDIYYEHQNNTGKSPNQTLNQLGLIAALYF